MKRMFSNALTFNQDIGDWNVAKVDDTSDMFYNAKAFNQDIGDWDVGAVTDMKRLFEDATEFNQDLGWCVTAYLSETFLNAKCAATTCGVGVAMDNATIRTAVAAWIDDPEAAVGTWGNITTWCTADVTDMSFLFCFEMPEGRRLQASHERAPDQGLSLIHI